MGGTEHHQKATSWSDLKALATSKLLNIQYTESTAGYRCFISEPGGVIYWVVLWKDGHLPVGTPTGQNTTDRTDFLDNFQSTANKAILSKSSAYDSLGNPITSVADGAGRRLCVDVKGEVSTIPPIPPLGASEFTVSADTPLSITGTHDTEYVVTTGKAVRIQQISAGAEGDPTEKGNKVEVIFNDGTEHLVERVYITGFTQSGIYPNTSKARDGTPITGNA